MKKLYRNFLESLKVQLSPEITSYKRFMTEDTFLGNGKFSFKDHEFQEYVVDVIENNPGKTFSVSKPSQIGLSELFNRLVLAIMAVKPRSSVLISFPSKSFSQEVLKTRIAGVIQESPALNALRDSNNDSASVKAFVNGSIMYALGGSKQSNTSLLNRPISVCFCDELDRQDKDIVSSYATRMVHTAEEDRLVLNVSTPTADGIGINAQIQQCGELHTPWVGCPCGHEFIADYYEHVVLPGFDEPLSMLTREKASSLDLNASYLECPECKIALDKHNKKTVWKITYNEKGLKDEIGITLDPFAAMGFRFIPAIVKDSIRMSSQEEFTNQVLGKVADTTSTTIQPASIVFNSELKVSGAHIFGLDFGKECHFLHGVQKADTTIHVLESHIIRLSEVDEFLRDQHNLYAYSAGVVDSQPYSDLVYKLVKKYPRLFSAVYVSPNPPKPELYTMKMMDKYGELVRQLTINKSLAMDMFAATLNDFYTFEPGPLDASIIKHLTDMRRIRDHRFEEMIYKWVKSAKGVDHFFHTVIYLMMAGKIAFSGVTYSSSVPIIIQKMNPDLARLKNMARRR